MGTGSRGEARRPGRGGHGAGPVAAPGHPGSSGLGPGQAASLEGPGQGTAAGGPEAEARGGRVAMAAAGSGIPTGLMAAAAGGAALWRRLSAWLPRGRLGLAALLGRLSDRLSRGRDRRARRSSWLLLAPLLTPPVPVITAPPCLLCPEGAHRFQWIRNLVPEFGISSSHVKVLSSPAEFYELLKVQIKTAKQRVVMASLYLGTGLLEQELVDCLEETLEKSLQTKGSSNLRVSILLDYTRGSRGRKNSRTMLIPLLQRFPDQVRVSLFHTPNLRGLLRLLIPERFNETIGLQHIKDSPEIADFFTELVDAIGDVSLQLQRDDTVQMMEGMVHPYQGDKTAYCEIANQRVMEVINSARTRQELLHAKTFHSSQQGSSLLSQQGSQASGGLKPEPDTWIYPLIQMKPFGIQIDEMVTETLLTEAERDARIYLTTGYFNLTQAYMDLILGTRAEYRILLASPEVNGFFGAKGVAGAIPAAYVYIEHQFYSEVCYLHQQERVQLQEYSRAGWTFHAKGLWLYLAGSNLPCLTLIGSPNFGYRSVHRDLEAQVAIVTENTALQQQLHQEQEQLYLCSGVVSSSTFEQPNRYVKLWVKLVTPLIKNFF
ncbi:CDP-diacylglycerol--glycerol-3-phosphate 3-phosphatidyltransferase, mitochondrial isoform X3 [Falco rusticolus]|uniref:CDP-diacylglycerol--glycerol-3-phosphate 3-phosphatidyltransferase, mitochondrial isoform X3 n=1 Tax=Falco rusticolus TaxID=120794 RepID=UPI00188660E8|nr:CDP-diacylglycerol--glycerol-3-phosphate 3-phosphatidyltransferase, mitochondrial isoform X3 [Falco rusticolus]XP_055553160.1 CDP-diacylglycerol--glycerol-3-phosphate 3-phosphatidyltransferase, mitochondrial isoform X2 [Falco cherrug]